MVPVVSSVIAAVGYDPEERRLWVDFVSGRRYVYDGVGARTHRELLDAESVGSYFNREIRDRYPFTAA
jgi:lysyl-tRNA synthetase class 2